MVEYNTMVTSKMHRCDAGLGESKQHTIENTYRKGGLKLLQSWLLGNTYSQKEW